VLALSQLRGLDFDARLFAIEAVEDAHGQREQSSSDKMAGGEVPRRNAGDRRGEERDLRRCDRRPAESANDPGFDGSVNFGGQIERPVLRSVENQIFRVPALLRGRDRKPEWPDFSSERRDVPRLLFDINDL